MDELKDNDPRRIGPYTVLGRLGRGGMGLVYLARDEAGAQVAVKVVHAHLADDPRFRSRFRQEVAAAQRVARFCTAPVLAADVDGALAYLVTEFVPGPSLEQAVQTGGPLTGSSLDGLAASIAVALRAIHRAQVVHRDLKPSNVLLSPVGPKVIDFGIARLVENPGKVSSVLVGTPAFMSPEQVKGEPATPASDVFAWGGVLVFAASGHGPFGTGAAPALLYRVAHHEPDLSGLPGHLLPLVTAALAKDPADRPTPQDLLDELSAGPVDADATSPPGRVAVAARPDVLPAPEEPGATGGPAGPSTHDAEPGETGRVRGGGAGTGTHGAMIAEGSPGRSRTRLWAGAGAALSVFAVAVTLLVASRSETVDGSSRSSPPATADSRTTAPGTAGGRGTTPSAAAAAGPFGASGHNPLDEGGVRFFNPPDSGAARQAESWAASGRHEQDVELMRMLSAVPRAVWLKGTAAETRRTVSATVEAASRTGAVPVFVVYNLPMRNCQAAGAKDGSAYRAWVREVAEGIGGARAVLILEPNSLGNVPGTEGCGRGDDEAARERFRSLAYAVGRFGELPRSAVYLDGSFEKWPPPSTIAHRLVEAGIDGADGFFLNVGAYQPTGGLVEYGTRLAKCVHVQVTARTNDCLDAEIGAAPDDPAVLPHFVIDTSRNGRGEWIPDEIYLKPQTWCNPPGRGAGLRPATVTNAELVDAYLWISDPGLANGPCTRGTVGPEDPVYGAETPRPGTFWPELALERARLANPPLP